MNIAILTFEGFNELDSFIALGILNRMKSLAWNVQITCPTSYVTSMNGLKIQAQQNLEFANSADVVVFGSGINTRNIIEDKSIMNRLKLNPSVQLLCAQCSGSLFLEKLGFLNSLAVCTDLTTKPWLIDKGVEVLDLPFFAKGNIASAGGCMSSEYLATWIILKLKDINQAKLAIHYVAPVGEKESRVSYNISIVSSFLK